MTTQLDLDKHKGTGQTEVMLRKRWLHNKGVIQSKPVQLSFLFTEFMGEREDLRHIPNDYGRSSLFTSRNKNIPRRALVHEKLFHYNEFVSILYSGVELRAEDDEIVWLQILKYGEIVPLGQEFEFSIKDLVRDVGWSKNGRYYDKARECISRLRGNEVLAKNTKAYGTSGEISLIKSYTSTNDSDGKQTHYKACLDPNLVVMFAGSSFTSHKWDVYRKLSPVARRLTDYIESHRNPLPLKIDRFLNMCGSDNKTLTSWRQTVKKACLEVEVAAVHKRVKLMKDDFINFVGD